MAMKNQRPSAGYDTHAKWAYGRQLEAHIDELCPVPKDHRVRVYLDTRDARESIHALDLGYLPQNLVAVNWSGREIGLAKRRFTRLDIPKPRFAVGRLEAIIASFHNAHVVNYDGCPPFGTKASDETIRRIAEQLPQGCVLSVNARAARDGVFIQPLLQDSANGGDQEAIAYNLRVRADYVEAIVGTVRQIADSRTFSYLNPYKDKNGDRKAHRFVTTTMRLQ